MDDFNIDHSEIRRLVRDAERMRSEALAELLVTSFQRISRAVAAVGQWALRLNQRRKLNLSVPAPHR